MLSMQNSSKTDKYREESNKSPLNPTTQRSRAFAPHTSPGTWRKQERDRSFIHVGNAQFNLTLGQCCKEAVPSAPRAAPLICPLPTRARPVGQGIHATMIFQTS